MSVWTQLFPRNWRFRWFARGLSQGCSETIRKKDVVVMTAERCSSWSIQILQFLIIWWHSMKAGSITMTQRPRERESSQRKHAGPPRPKKARQSKSNNKHLMIPFFDSREVVELNNSDPAVLDNLVTYDESWIYYYDPETNREEKLGVCRYETIEEMKEAVTRPLKMTSMEPSRRC